MKRWSPIRGVGLIVSSTVLVAIIVLMVVIPSSVEIVAAAAGVVGTLIAVLTFLGGSAEKSG